MTAAHDQRLTLHFVTHVPEHAPRADDPHYRACSILRCVEWSE